MSRLVDLIYLIAAVVSSPVWLVRMSRTGKIRTDWPARFGRTPPLPLKSKPRILFHAVSVGEVNAIRLLVDQLAADPLAPELIIATTTDTGFARASSLWKSRHQVVRYPFDFSFAIRRFLNAVEPDVTVLVELEVWPNFTAACQRRGIPVLIVNGRLTERSFRRYRRTAPLVRPCFRRISIAAVQNETYAKRIIALGTSADAVRVTGTMKWDTAQIADTVAGADQLVLELGIDRSRPLIVAGSTAPDEHKLLLASKPQGVQLLCAPRKPEWFDQAAADLSGCVRRSQPRPNHPSSDVFLLDSIGELRQAYALADVVVIGRSFGNLHGSDMMEPVALGKATIVGPAVSDFQDTVDALLAGEGLIQTTSAQLPIAICELLANPVRRQQLAANGRAVIRRNQGATARHAELILEQLKSQNR